MRVSCRASWRSAGCPWRWRWACSHSSTTSRRASLMTSMALTGCSWPAHLSLRLAQRTPLRKTGSAQVVQKLDLPMGLVYTVQSLIFGVGFLGISWGVLSASWDPQRKGGVLGVDEVKRNFPVLWQDLRKK